MIEPPIEASKASFFTMFFSADDPDMVRFRATRMINGSGHLLRCMKEFWRWHDMPTVVENGNHLIPDKDYSKMEEACINYVDDNTGNAVEHKVW